MAYSYRLTRLCTSELTSSVFIVCTQKNTKTWNRLVVFAYFKSIDVGVSFQRSSQLAEIISKTMSRHSIWNICEIPNSYLISYKPWLELSSKVLEPGVINHAARGPLAELQPFLCPLIEHFSTYFWQAQDYQNKPKSRVTNEVLQHVFKTAAVSTEPSEIDHILM